MSQPLFASGGRIIIAVAGFAIATATPSLANPIPTSPLEVIQGMELAQTPSVEADTVESLPDAIANAVLDDISRRHNLNTSQLKILNVARQTWSDGCLGLGDDQICTQALVPGWRTGNRNGKTSPCSLFLIYSITLKPIFQTYK